MTTLYGVRQEMLEAYVAAERKKVWEAAARWGDEQVAHWNPFPHPFENTSNCSPEDIGWQRRQARAQEAAEYASWCRAQTEKETL